MVGMALWLWCADSRAWVRRLGWTALAAVIVQGVLGGLTVLYLLPDAISISHAGLAQVFFCLDSYHRTRHVGRLAASDRGP